MLIFPREYQHFGEVRFYEKSDAATYEKYNFEEIKYQQHVYIFLEN